MTDTQSDSSDVRRSTLHLAALGAIVGILAAVFLSVRNLNPSEVQPLVRDASLFTWRRTPEQQRHATAEMLLDILRDEDKLGPETEAQLAAPVQRSLYVEQLKEGIDSYADNNSEDYAAPGEPIDAAAFGVVKKRGWDR